jgi:hypothetical protein
VKSLSESPAILTVHAGAAGQYIVRVGDLRYRPLIVGVTKLLPDASSLVVITPSDIKVYAVNGDGATRLDRTDVVEDDVSPLDPETLAAIAKEEGRAIPGDVTDSPDADIVGETSQGTKVVRRKKSPTPVAGHDEQCQRCGGEGQIQLLMDGGTPAATTCPICKGSGTMRRYGAKR